MELVSLPPWWGKDSTGDDDTMIEGRLTAADLFNLPAPDIVERLDFEQILSSCKDDLQAVLDREYPALGVKVHELPETDSINKVLEIVAYRELYIRQRINEATRDCLLASATGDGLRNLASWLIGWQDETPEDMRRRVLVEFDAYQTAGTAAAYIHFAKAVAPHRIKDVHVASPRQGAEVNISLLPCPDHAGLADRPERAEESRQLVAEVQARLDEDTIRPIGHRVIVKMATIHRYAVKARIGVRDMPGVGEVATAGQEAVTRYVKEQYRPGRPVLKSALLAAVFRPGVRYAILDEPKTDPPVATDEAAFCDDVQVTINKDVPEELVKGVDLQDVTVTKTDSNRRLLSGELVFEPPEHEVRLEYYGVYWADDDGNRLQGHPSIAALRAGGKRGYTFETVSIPKEAGKVVVFSGNENGEMARGVSVEIPGSGGSTQ